MKKSELLKLLEDIPDDSEVYLWNGFVGDWVDINGIVPSDLVKMTRETMRELCRVEKCVAQENWQVQHTKEELVDIDAAYNKNYKWDMNPYVTLEDIKEGRYKKKKIFLIDAKLKGESKWDRMGDMNY